MIKIINVYKDSRVMEMTSSSNLGLGVMTDNEVDLLRFTFDEMIVGTATLLTDLKDDNGDFVAFPLTINQEENSYDLEITNYLVSQPSVTFQIEISLPNEAVWHSKQATLQVIDCLEVGEGDMPTTVENWLQNANIVLAEMEEATTEAEKVNIEVEEGQDQYSITITDRDGNEHQAIIHQGEDAIISGATASVDNTVGTPSVNVTMGGTESNRTFNFAFHNLKGNTGEAGYTPEFGIDYWTPEQQQEIISTATTNTINNYSSTITQIQSNASNALNTANTAYNTANTAKSIAEGANQALSYANYQAMVTAFNSLDDDVYRVGQNVMIVTLNVPDLWVSSIESTSTSYTYTNDEAITTALSTNGYVQIGYYKLSALETQKVDLTDYYTKTGTENKIEDYLYQIMPTDSTSEAIATINDATTMFNAIDVSGTINPVQDLHGYNNPWSAGGGKNKAKFWQNAYIKSEGVIGSSDSNGMIYPLFVQNNEKVTGSLGSFTSMGLAVFESFDGTTLSNMLFRVGSTSIATYSYLASQDCYCVFWFNQGTSAPSVSQETFDEKNAQVEFGNATSYEPYENICPITGWTGMNVTRTGKNLFDETYPNIGTGSNPKYLAIFVGDNTVTLSSTIPTNNDTNIRNLFLLAGNVTTGADSNISGVSANYPQTVTAVDGYVTVAYRAYMSNDPRNYKTQLEIGSSVTSYEAYTGTSVSVDWTDVAGTVYGGTLDVTTGVLTVTKVLYEPNTVLTVSYHQATGLYYWIVANASNIPYPAPSNNVAEIISSHFKEVSGVVRGGCYVTSLGKVIVAVPVDQSLNTKELATAWVQENHPTFCYKIAQPFEYQLTPQQISFLQGTNNLWVNTGDISVTYKADIQKYIDKKTS